MPSPETFRNIVNYVAVGLGAGIFVFVFLYKPKIAMSASTPTVQTQQKSKAAPANLETVTLGAGCFWCTQAVLERVDGVWEVTCGYMGGTVPNPTYEQVCTGLTGHAEVVQVKFDPAVISFSDLLKWFWKLHDPTTLNRQGNDTGTQYRSVIFYTSASQKLLAERSKSDAQNNFKDTIVTEILPAKEFYKADEHHQEYFNKNGTTDGYCRVIIAPKLNHLQLTEEPATAPGAAGGKASGAAGTGSGKAGTGSGTAGK